MDYFVVRGRHYDSTALFQKGGPYWGFKGFNLDGYAAWIVGAVVYPVAAWALPSVGGSVLSFLAAAAVYWVLASWRARRNAAPATPEPAVEA
jgi:cytosine/uracil/thiamine/allantoin permease